MISVRKILLLVLAITPLSLFAGQKIVNGIPVNNLKGSYFKMGKQYGTLMKVQMHKSLKIIKNYYINDKQLTYSELLNQASELYERFPNNYKQLLKGAAKGANISLNDEIILNGMETLVVLKSKKPNLQSGCAFASISPQYSYSDKNIILRNYDYIKPFDKIAKYLSITTFNFTKGQPVAIIALPGQLYCPSCINKQGIFIELNNGSISGGTTVNTNTESMLVKLLDNLRTSSNLKQLSKKLNSQDSDFSLIINAADNDRVISYEYSSLKGHKENPILDNENFVVTNNFLNPKWKDSIPKPTIKEPSLSIERRENLTNLIDKHKNIDIDAAKSIMNTKISDGGARFPYTIYQIIYDTKTKNIYINLEDKKGWRKVEFNQIFN